MEDPSMMYPFAEPCFFSETEYLVDSVTFPGANMNINTSSSADKSSSAPASYYLDYSHPDSHHHQQSHADVIDADAIFLSSSLDHTGASFIDSSLSSLSTPSPTNDAALYASLVSDDHGFVQHQDQYHMQQAQGHYDAQQFVGHESQMEDADVADSYLGKRTYLEHLSDGYCYGMTGDVIDTSPETLSSSAEFDPFVSFGSFDHSRSHSLVSESFQLNTNADSAPADEDITACADQQEYHGQQQQQQNDSYQSYTDARFASSSPGPVSTSDYYLSDEMTAEDSFPDAVSSSDPHSYYPPPTSYYPFALHPDCSDCSQSHSDSHSHAHSHPHAHPHAFPHPHQPLYALPTSRPFLTHSAPHSHGQSYAVAMPQKQRRVASSVNAYAHFHQQQHQHQHHYHQHQNFEYAPFSPDAYPFDACYNSCCVPNQHLQQQQQPHYFTYSAGAPERKKCRLDEEGNFVSYNGEGQVTQATSPYAQNRFMSSQQVLYSQGPVPQGPMMRGPVPTPSAAAIKRQQEQQQQKQQKVSNAKPRQTKPREKPAAAQKPRRTASTNSLPAAPSTSTSATGSTSPSAVTCASSVPVSVSQLASPSVLALSKSPLMLSPKMSPRKPAPLALPPSDASSASTTKSACLFIKPSPSPSPQQQQVPTPSSSASTSTTPSSSTASPCSLASPTPTAPLLAPKAPEASSSPSLQSPNENTNSNTNAGTGASTGGNVASTLAQIADLRSLLQKNIESSMLLALRDSFSRASKQTKDMLHQKESIYDSLPPAVNFFDQLSMQLLSSPVANNASPASASTSSPSSSVAAPSATSVPKNVSYKVPISSPTMGANVSNTNGPSNFHLPPAAIYSQVPRSIAPMYSVLNGPLPVGSPLLMPSASGPMFSPPHALALSPASQRPAQKTSPLSKSRSTSSVSSSPLISATKLNFKPEPSFTTPLGSKSDHPNGVTSPPLVSRSVFNPSMANTSSCGQSVILSGPRPSPAPMALNQPQGGKVPLQRA
eukprot:TRINITY_DN814_c0_g1_i1.p1 TRINITY_DN814_c0_g1~~TRINITY_DN814_c0_g1_i1.p1  ORF type:complete len:1042 (+),score=447.36 TRINITY_DN814_c0_g1_i1:136-3126(+)